MDQDHPARAEWARRRKAMFGFEPDPAYTLAPFHPEAVNGMIGRLLWHADGTVQAGLIPIHVEAPGRPVLADPDQRDRIGRYIEDITIGGGLPPIQLAESGEMLVFA
jgi:poly-gamma-glutamate synthesis protein (capsule biosynthesis protein)